MKQIKLIAALSGLAAIGGLIIVPATLADTSDATVKVIDQRAGGEVKFKSVTEADIEFEDLIVDGSKTEDIGFEKVIGQAKITVLDTRDNHEGRKPYEVKVKAEDANVSGMFDNKMEITLKPTSTQSGNGVEDLTTIKLNQADSTGGALFSLPFTKNSAEEKIVILNPELKVTDTSILKDQSYGSIFTWTLGPRP